MSKEEIIKLREDLSDYVYHFTKGKDAKETLKIIVSDKKIKDVMKKGYICFSESPLTMLAPMFNYFEQFENPLYAPYGIGVKKDVIYKLGGRPVFYVDREEIRIIPNQLRWKSVCYDPNSYDFSWLREWRLPHESLDLTFNDCFIVVKANGDISDIQGILELDDIDIDAQPEDGGILTEYTGHFTRYFKVISLEELSTISQMNKKQLLCALDGQSNQERHYLGSTWK